MSEQTTTPSEPAGANPRRSRLPIIVTIALCCVAAASVYLWARGSSVRPVSLALVTWNNDPFWDRVISGAEDAAEEWTVKLTTIRSTPEMETQSRHVRDLLGKRIDGIAISPNNPQAQAALLNEAADKTVLITFDSDAPDSKRRLFVGTDDYAAGGWAADEVRDALPDGGAVIISVGSLETVNGRDRRQGLIDALLDRPFDRSRTPDPVDAPLKGAKYSIAATVLDGADVARGKTLIADALRSHPEAKCIVGLWSYSAEVALGGIEQSGKSPGAIKVIAFDESPATQAGIEAGSVQASIIQDQYRIGYEAIRSLASTVRGLEQGGPLGPRVIHTPVHVLRRDNLEEFRAQNRIRRPASKGDAAQSTTGPTGGS
jgi:ribose transport system substrate-binding protein